MNLGEFLLRESYQVIDWFSSPSVLEIAGLVKDLEGKMGHQRECYNGGG
jgi:hypothetical protein